MPRPRIASAPASAPRKVATGLVVAAVVLVATCGLSGPVLASPTPAASAPSAHEASTGAADEIHDSTSRPRVARSQDAARDSLAEGPAPLVRPPGSASTGHRPWPVAPHPDGRGWTQRGPPAPPL